MIQLRRNSSAAEKDSSRTRSSKRVSLRSIEHQVLYFSALHFGKNQRGVRDHVGSKHTIPSPLGHPGIGGKSGQTVNSRGEAA